MTTFIAFAEQLVTERAKYIRGPEKEWNRFTMHVRNACFAEMPIDQIRPRHIGQWHAEMIAKRAADRRGDRPLSKPTIERCHALVSVVFVEAVRRELAQNNPCVGMKLRMPVGEAQTKEKWTYFTVEEQDAIRNCAAIPDADRWMILFAIGTGLRQGEQFNLLLTDLHVDGAEPHVYVRFGSKGKPPKSGRCRRVPLFGVGLDAARRWLEILPSYAKANPEGLAFPSKRGTRKSVGKPLGRSVRVDGKWTDPFKIHLKAAGIEKRARWHDCRHACASALVMGMWGRARTLAEIRDLLGHSSVSITERYAHLGDDALKRMARELEEDARARATPTATPMPAAANDAPGCIVGLFRGLIEIVRRPVHREERAA